MASLEHIYTSPDGFGVPASPAQRGICRVIEGLPLGDLATDPDVIACFGGEAATAALSGVRPVEVDWLSGIRSGKSRLVAALAVLASQSVDVTHLATGEIPRVSIVSLRLDAAQVVLDHLLGAVLASRVLRALLLGEPSADGLVLRHPSGRPIEIKVTHGGRAGGGLVSRWSAGCIFDEFTRMTGEADGSVANYDDARRAVLGRLLPGAQIVSIGSPWAPFGPAYERHEAHFGKPTPELVVAKTTGPQANPAWWTPARCAALEKSDPTAYATDVECKFADPSSAALAQSDVRHAVRKDEPGDLPPMGQRRWYVAAMDPATRGNSWTLVLLGAFRDSEGMSRFEVVLCREWIGSPSQPLSPGAVLGEVARVLAPYGVGRVVTDQHAGDFVAEIARRVGLDVVIRNVVAGAQRVGTPTSSASIHKVDAYQALATVFAQRLISIPDSRQLIADLLSIRRVTTRSGIAFDLPTTANGRHADYAAALALAVATTPSFPDLRADAAREQRIRDVASSWPMRLYTGVPVGDDDESSGPSLWRRLAELETSGALAAEQLQNEHEWAEMLARRRSA